MAEMENATAGRADEPSENAFGSGRTNLLRRLNEIADRYAGVLGSSAFAAAFERAALGQQNQPQIQNSRIKSISALPVDYTKEQIGAFLRKPYNSEHPLRQTSEILRWTNYPYYKIIKTYQDIPTDHYYAQPRILSDEDAKSDTFRRESALVEKLNRAIDPTSLLHEIRGHALLEGKCFYATRYEVDKSHNAVRYAMLTQLPTDRCRIIGRNNISKWTVSFDMMYFIEPGTDVTQYGDLFFPYIDAFQRMFTAPQDKEHYVYASYRTQATVKRKGKSVRFFPENVLSDSPGKPRVFEQNGTWAYYVSLPIDRVWTFEIDDTTPAVIPPLSGMMLTYAQQADFEEIQKTLYTNPLVKIFTGEIPYFSDDGTRVEDTYKLSEGGRMLFQYLFDRLMAENNTAGTAMFLAPVQNIRSHDYAESANANKISTTFNQYAGAKVGLAALIPVDEDIKAAQVEVARLIESRYPSAVIYAQFAQMMNTLYASMNLRYEWEFKVFGTIFTDAQIRKDAETSLARGDTSALFTLAAMDGMSISDKASMLRAVEASGIMDLYRVPETAYTQSGGSGGRPRTEGITSEAKEKSIDMGYSDAGEE